MGEETGCDNCLYSDPTVTEDDDLIIKCRRYPPVLVVVDNEIIQTFPDAGIRCGEFKPKEIL